MKATDLPTWAWRNPEEVAIRREEMSCEGCIFRLVLQGTPTCVKHKGRSGQEMYSCTDYRETKR